jgi:hypothetical protein
MYFSFTSVDALGAQTLSLAKLNSNGSLAWMVQGSALDGVTGAIGILDKDSMLLSNLIGQLSIISVNDGTVTATPTSTAISSTTATHTPTPVEATATASATPTDTPAPNATETATPTPTPVEATATVTPTPIAARIEIETANALSGAALGASYDPLGGGQIMQNVLNNASARFDAFPLGSSGISAGSRSRQGNRATTGGRQPDGRPPPA